MTRIVLVLAALIAWCFVSASAAQNVTVIGPITPGNIPQFNSTTVIKDSGIPGAPGTGIRTRLQANADYYVGRDGNDSCTGLANLTYNVVTNPTNCRWLTIGKSLSAISSGIDLAGFNVVVHVNGNNVGDGTYTENLILPFWLGYSGGTPTTPFNQFTIQGENGTATITGANSGATILALIGGTAAPIQFKNFTLANANASGIILEADDGGFLPLNTIIFGSTGAGGILAISTQSSGRLLFMAGTFTMQAGLSTGTGFYGRSGGAVIFQPGVTVNFAGASTFSNAVADFATDAYFDNAGSTWSGTTPTGKSYVLDKNTGGLITTPGLIPGTIGPTITPNSVANGGTGQVTATLAFQALAPVPTRAGDVIYWNGSTWVTIAGNNSGTQILSENASGVPAWSAAGTGSVTSVTCGTGLSGGTFTTSGTCTVSLSVITNSLGANVALNNTGTYFDGPSVAQGASGMWCATGNVTFQDTAAASGFNLKLWDGTTVISSARVVVTTASAPLSFSLSGCLNTPAGNLRISVNDSSATSGTMVFNASGNSKDSTITAWRVQ